MSQVPESESTRDPGLHRIVIVGGGFAGTRAADHLAHLPVDITLVDRVNHHLFQPLLYQVATGELSDGQIAPALRGMYRTQRSVRVLLGDVQEIDVRRRIVHARSVEPLDLSYDTLVLAGGSADSYFGHEGWARWALPMKSLDDAERIRSRILGAFEMAEQTPAGAERDAWLTFAIVGAGPTGVELSGQLGVLTHRVLRDEYRSIDPSASRIVLLDAETEILPAFADSLRRRAHRDLEDLGVEVRVGHSVTGVDAQGVDADGPAGSVRVDARTILWSAGVKAAPLAELIARAVGVTPGTGGRVPVQDDLSLAGHPEIFVAGDMADLDGVPGLAPAAIQQGTYVGRVIAARLEGHGAPRPFHYVDKGTLATIGRQKAIAEVKGLRFAGLPAFLLWAVVHLFYLVGWGNRFGAVTRWMWSLFARNRREQLISMTSLVESDADAARELGTADDDG